MNKGWIDLHVHLDGSLPFSLVRRLAAMQKIPIPQEDAALRNLLTVSASCRDLNAYLEKFSFPLLLLQVEDAIEEATFALSEALLEEGLLYAEIRFAPQLHCQKGLSMRRVVEAALRGKRRSELPSGLILCCMRTDNHALNMETVRLAAEYKGKGVVGLDLAGAEALFPTKDFYREFAAAKEAGVSLTVHAGEAAGAESVYAAIKAGADRIGHGVRAAEDKEVMQILSQSNITLECCPTSNLQTRVFSNISAYPVRTFLEKGVKFTVNTDNRTVSDTTISREWELLENTFLLTDEEKKKILITAAEAAFADAQTKAALKSEIMIAFGG